MTKNPQLFVIIVFIFVLISCKSDDGYEGIVIATSPDTGEVFQNATVEIDVLANDSNVPQVGYLVASPPQWGTVSVLDPNETANDPSDDIVLYEANDEFIGQDTFQYTICETATNCQTETVTVRVLQASPVNFNIDLVPYDTLSEYNFFEGDIAEQAPVYGVIPYAPLNKLFSDYALKKRFIWMPTGVSASITENFEVFESPTGTILVKTFYYENVQPNNTTQIIETRLLIKKDTGWEFANYIWNEDQTEATLDASGNGGFVELEWLQGGAIKNVNYRIPSSSECFTCHKSFGENVPIGTKPQNLNFEYTYDGEVMNQLDKLRQMGYLESVPGDVSLVTDWTDTSQPLRDRVRGYFDINCASCHIDGGHCDYRFLRFSFHESDDDRNLGICETPDTPIPGFDKIVDPNNLPNSVLHFRLSTTAEEYRMPLLGRRLVHDEGVALIEEWINSLTDPCN